MALADRYEAPMDYVQQKGGAAAGFSQEATMANKELWVLRIPDDVSAKDLDGLTIKNPQSTGDGIVNAAIKINGRTYQMVTPKATDVSAEFRGTAELSVLLPDDDEKNKLTLAATRFAQTMALVENIEFPESVELATRIAERVRPARAQPDNMTLRFIPYGFYSADEYRTMSGNGNGNDKGKSNALDRKRAASDAAADAEMADKGDSSADDGDAQEAAKHKKSKKEKKDKKE
ncbi:hypothetical protein LPJ56_000191 [Coemansia sp. RSA 2599]|nr:hypothetical protein LPJ56_000191 [Coemansia sp. RSA 2599]